MSGISITLNSASVLSPCPIKTINYIFHWIVSMEFLPATSLLSILFQRNLIDDFRNQEINNFLITNGAVNEENAPESSDIEVGESYLILIDD